MSVMFDHVSSHANEQTHVKHGLETACGRGEEGTLRRRRRRYTDDSLSLFDMAKLSHDKLDMTFTS